MSIQENTGTWARHSVLIRTLPSHVCSLENLHSSNFLALLCPLSRGMAQGWLKRWHWELGDVIKTWSQYRPVKALEMPGLRLKASVESKAGTCSVSIDDIMNTEITRAKKRQHF